MEDLKSIVGQFLRKARGGISLLKVYAGTGISDRRVSAIEKGKANITLKTFEKLCEFYGIKDELIEKFKQWIEERG